MRRAVRWAKRTMLATAVLALLLILFAHRWFAVTRPSGARDLVVEGWLYAGGCDSVAAWYRHGGYERVYTTGTLRPFSYHLRHGDTLSVRFDPPASGHASLRIDGLPQAIAFITADGMDTIEAAPSAGAIALELDGCAMLRVVASSANPPPDGQPVIFAGHLEVEGVNAHALSTIAIEHADGRTEDGWPSFAHEAAACLMAAGIPAASITTIPAAAGNGGRTWSNAHAFARFAQENSIRSFDVATMGVHARRTWRMYRKAMGGDEGIGVRSIHDPWCARGRWWRNPFGWILVLKEVIAIPAPALIGEEERRTGA